MERLPRRGDEVSIRTTTHKRVLLTSASCNAGCEDDEVVLAENNQPIIYNENGRSRRYVSVGVTLHPRNAVTETLLIKSIVPKRNADPAYLEFTCANFCQVNRVWVVSNRYVDVSLLIRIFGEHELTTALALLSKLLASRSKYKNSIASWR